MLQIDPLDNEEFIAMKYATNIEFNLISRYGITRKFVDSLTVGSSCRTICSCDSRDDVEHFITYDSKSCIYMHILTGDIDYVSFEKKLSEDERLQMRDEMMKVMYDSELGSYLMGVESMYNDEQAMMILADASQPSHL